MSSTSGDPREYARADVSKIEVAKQRVASDLEGRKRENAVSSKALAERTPVSASTVRDLVPEIRREYELPVVSGPRGYYEVQEHGDFLRVMEREQHAIETKQQRMRELSKAWNKRRYMDGI